MHWRVRNEGVKVETCDSVVVVTQNEPNVASLTNRIRMHEESGSRTPTMTDWWACSRPIACKPTVFPFYNGLSPNRYVCKVRRTSAHYSPEEG